MRNSAGRLRRILVLRHWKQWDQITCHIQHLNSRKPWLFHRGNWVVGRPLTQAVSPVKPSCWGGVTDLEGLPNWIASLLLQLRSDNQCRGVSKRPWWMITCRSQWMPCGFNLFLTSDISQSCQVTQTERYQRCQCKSSLNHKGIIFVRFNIIAPLFPTQTLFMNTAPCYCRVVQVAPWR